jgi:hypothetical protein
MPRLVRIINNMYVIQEQTLTTGITRMTLENYVEKLERTKKKNDRNDHRAYSTQ